MVLRPLFVVEARKQSVRVVRRHRSVDAIDGLRELEERRGWWRHEDGNEGASCARGSPDAFVLELSSSPAQGRQSTDPGAETSASATRREHAIADILDRGA